MSSKIHGAEYPVQKIFSNDFVFEIPLYQRPYAWMTEQAGELFDDIRSFLGTGEIAALDPYFLGSIVLIKGDGPKSEVIDGQQRLTTLTILLSAIRASLQTDKPVLARAVDIYLFQAGDALTGTPNIPRLALRERDGAFFKKYVQEAEGAAELATLDPVNLSDPQKNIRANFKLFMDRLEKLDVSERARLAQFIVLQCLMVVVSTPDMDSAYRIFSVMNDRGMDLSYTDILKSEVIGTVPAGQREQYAKKWEALEEDLGREAFQDLFAHIRTIYRKAKPQDTLLKEIRRYVEPAKTPVDFIDRVLEPYTQAFLVIRFAEYQSTHDPQKINALLGWLNRIDNFDWMLLAIAFFTRHKDEQQLLQAFLTQLERLAAGMMILRSNVNERITRYGRLLEILEAQGNLLATDSALFLSADERHRILAALDGDLYEMTKIRLYVLLRLDAALSGGDATYAYKTLSIEHVLPQNPKPDSIWVRWFTTPEQRLQYVHRIGNLVLLSRAKNSQAGNLDFEQKKREYFTSKHGVSTSAVTTKVLEQTKWTPEILEARQKEAMEKLQEVWNL